MLNVLKQYGNDMMVTSFPVRLPAYEHPDKRTQPVGIDYPVYFRDTVIYQFAGTPVKNVPEKISVQSKFGHYSLEYNIFDEYLLVSKTIFIDKGVWGIDDYPAFHSFINEIVNNEKITIHIKP